MSQKRMSDFNTISLGGFIEALEGWCVLAEKENGGAAKTLGCHVYYDWASAVPSGLGSYRGYYEHLALGYTNEDGTMKVGELLALLKEAVGKTYTGWKGGQFKMTRKTPVWIGNSGHCSGTTIKDISNQTHAAIIITCNENG